MWCFNVYLEIVSKCSNLNVHFKGGDGFQAVDREARREEQAQIAAHLWIKLDKLKIISEVGEVAWGGNNMSILLQVGEWLVVRLVGACPNLTNLSLGMHTSLTDGGLRKILASNRWDRGEADTNIFPLLSLSELRHFKCSQSQHLSMESVSLLLDNCKNLVTCLELDCWAGISPQELEDTKIWVSQT